MTNTCTPMDQEAFKNAAASLRFRFNPNFQAKWDSAVTINEDGTVRVKNYDLFYDLMKMPLEKLHGEIIIAEMEKGEGTFRELSNSRWALTRLGLHPTVENDLLLDSNVDVSGVLLDIANDATRKERINGVDHHYPGGVNAAKVIYVLKILEHVATHSTDVEFYGSGIKAGEEDAAYTEAIAPARGHMAVHNLSQHLSPVSGEGKFQASSIFMHTAGIHVLKNIFLGLKAKIRPELFERRIGVFSHEPVIGKEKLIINPRTELLHSMSGHNLLEALVHCTEENYGTKNLAENTVLVIAYDLATFSDTQGPVQLLLGSPALKYGEPTIGNALPENGERGREIISRGREMMFQGIFELFSLPPVLPYMGFSELEMQGGLRIVGDSPPIIPVPNLHKGDIRRISIDFLGRLGSGYAVGGLVLAIANMIAPFMDSDSAKIPPSIRSNGQNFFPNLVAACDKCGLPGNVLGAALLSPSSFYGDDGELAEGLMDASTFNAVAPLLVSAQVRAMSVREELCICDAHGHSKQPLWKLTSDLLSVARRKTLNGGDNSEQARFARIQAGLNNPAIEHVMRATGLKS